MSADPMNPRDDDEDVVVLNVEALRRRIAELESASR